MMPLVAAMLVLQPILDEATPLRLATTGTGDLRVEWWLDGALVAETWDGQAATIQVGSGMHALTAQTTHLGPWAALARPEPAGPGIAYVPAWSGRSEGVTPGAGEASRAFLQPLGVAVLAVALAGLAANRWQAWRARGGTWRTGIRGSVEGAGLPEDAQLAGPGSPVGAAAAAGTESAATGLAMEGLLEDTGAGRDVEQQESPATGVAPDAKEPPPLQF